MKYSTSSRKALNQFQGRTWQPAPSEELDLLGKFQYLPLPTFSSHCIKPVRTKICLYLSFWVQANCLHIHWCLCFSCSRSKYLIKFCYPTAKGKITMADIERHKRSKLSSEETHVMHRYSAALKIHFTCLAFIVTVNCEKKSS